MKRLSTAERLLELSAWIDSGYHRELRERSPLSQGNVAEDCHVTQSAVARWESKERRPRGQAALAYHRTLSRLAEAEAAQAAKTSASRAPAAANAPPRKVRQPVARTQSEAA